MSAYTIKLLEKKKVADGTMAFIFDKPAGFEFKGGQHADLTLINSPETDAEGPSRTFSIVSSPAEPFLEFATRMRDTAFKRILGNAVPGLEVKLEGPFGSMTLHKDQARPAVFLAGGIGITPFMSILRQAEAEKLPHKIFLFSANRRPEDAAFMDELRELEKKNPNFKFVGVMSQMPAHRSSSAGGERSELDWAGERGRIDAALLRKHLPDPSAPVYYLAGSPQMVAAMREIIPAAGGDEDSVRSEDFAGY